MSVDRLRTARIPSNLWEVTLATLPETCTHYGGVAKARAGVAELVDGCRGLYLYGPSQSGKSSAAAIIAKSAMAAGYKAAWLESALFPEIALGRARLDELVDLPGPGLVVLDAVGEEYPEGPGTAGLVRAVATLLASGFAFVVTSRREYQETREGESWFRTRYGSETYERLRGRVWPVRCGGYDWGGAKVADLRNFYENGGACD